MEQDQVKKLAVDFRIIEFLSKQDSIEDRDELAKLFYDFYLHFKTLKQKKEPSEEEFRQALIKYRKPQ